MNFVHNKRREITIPPGRKECPTCGKFIKKNEKHPTEIRIVRANNNYGGMGPGSEVEIETNELNNQTILLATMSLEEHEILEQARRKPKVPKKGAVAEMVEATLRNAKAQVTSVIERGKRRVERQREQAIAAGKDLPKNEPSKDSEPNSREHKEVEA